MSIFFIGIAGHPEYKVHGWVSLFTNEFAPIIVPSAISTPDKTVVLNPIVTKSWITIGLIILDWIFFGSKGDEIILSDKKSDEPGHKLQPADILQKFPTYK